jgi:hypothetical protein
MSRAAGQCGSSRRNTASSMNWNNSSLVPTGGGADGREKEGGIHLAGRERALSPRSHPRWQARAGGSQAVCWRRRARARGVGRE